MTKIITTVNPKNNFKIADYIELTPDEIKTKISASNEMFKEYSFTDFSFRKNCLQRLAILLRERKESLSILMTNEMGKPMAQSRAEVEKCAWVCDYYVENGESFLTEQIVKTDASKSFVAFEPLGIVLAVMPWNFPFWQVFRFAVPALMAGNTALLKHSSNVMGCAVEIEKLFDDSGFPKNVFQTLIIGSSLVQNIVSDFRVKAISLTGSTEAGKSVAELAGRHLKKCVLELGGSDPYLILEDADIDSAVDSCVTARLINGGQSCIAAKRFIICEKIYDEFEQKFISKMSLKKFGNPMDETNDLGPMASVKLRDELHAQVLASINGGAELKLGGFIPDSEGAYYPPTVLTNVSKNNVAFREELFGPVAPLIKVKDENEAIAFANDSHFGLGAALFTTDLERGEFLAKKKLNAGNCFVNTFVKSDPRLPFGGVNESGFGRELSLFGIREFVNIKSVFVK